MSSSAALYGLSSCFKTIFRRTDPHLAGTLVITYMLCCQSAYHGLSGPYVVRKRIGSGGLLQKRLGLLANVGDGASAGYYRVWPAVWILQLLTDRVLRNFTPPGNVLSRLDDSMGCTSTNA